MAVLQSKVRRVLAILLPRIQGRRHASPRPVMIGISGVQGCGKSSWASAMVDCLAAEHNVYAIAISLDDLYKTHADLVAQRDANPENKLYRTRGQPGTHDEQLAKRLFDALNHFGEGGEGLLSIPRFDKSRYEGEGDRISQADWPTITQRPDVIIFEGWCLGFQPSSHAAIVEKQGLARAGQLALNTPAQHQLAHLLAVNENLERYCDAFMGPSHFDLFVHLDTDSLRNVYAWRLQQEHESIRTKRSGMSDDQVRAFVDGYMPSYELYLDQLRHGFFADKGRMVRVVLDSDRRIQQLEEL